MDKKLLIAQPVAKELERFNRLYRESIFSDNEKIQKIIDYIMVTDGKHIRPILLLLAAKAFGEVNEITYSSAITVELLHTASLIHDDVIDESKMRRGQASVNAVFDNKMAVLVGDYFLSSALIKAVLTGNIDIITDISNLGRSLAEGELSQLSLVKDVILDESEYFEVIRKKTASLMSVCMKIGAISVNAPQAEVDKFTRLGEIFGICFQIKDDIFDYFSNNIGKPTGNDIREGKVTLPLLYALRNANPEVSSQLLKIIENYDFTDENIDILISFAKEHGGIEYAYGKIDEYKSKAEAIIRDIPNEEIRVALRNAIDYMVERSY